MPLAARIDDGGLPPQEVPPQRPVLAVGRPWAQAYPWPALTGSGSRDDIPDSFSRSFADAFRFCQKFYEKADDGE